MATLQVPPELSLLLSLVDVFQFLPDPEFLHVHAKYFQFQRSVLWVLYHLIMAALAIFTWLSEVTLFKGHIYQLFCI